MLLCYLAGDESAPRRRRAVKDSAPAIGGIAGTDLPHTTIPINDLKDLIATTTNTLDDTRDRRTLNDDPIGARDDYYIDYRAKVDVAGGQHRARERKRGEYDYNVYSNDGIHEGRADDTGIRERRVDGRDTDDNLDPGDDLGLQHENNDKTTTDASKTANNKKSNNEYDGGENKHANNNRNERKYSRTTHDDSNVGLAPPIGARNLLVPSDGKKQGDYYDYGYSDYPQQEAVKTGEPNRILYRFLPLIVNVISGAVCFYFARVSCKLCMQGFSFAFPLTLVTPVTAAIFCYLCHERGWTRVVIPYMDIGYWQCRLVQDRFFFFFLSGFILWGRRNVFEYHFSTLSCPSVIILNPIRFTYICPFTGRAYTSASNFLLGTWSSPFSQHVRRAYP